MARQIGLLKITGTIGGICFYRRDNLYYARAKSSLTGQRVKCDPAFSKTMAYAHLLGTASKIASERYRRTVPKAERSRRKYRELVSVVLRELKEEMVTKERRSSAIAPPIAIASYRHNYTQMNGHDIASFVKTSAGKTRINMNGWPLRDTNEHRCLPTATRLATNETEVIQV